MDQRRAELALLLNCILWGATFVLVKSALDLISPVLFLAWRFSLATLALVIILVWRSWVGRSLGSARGDRRLAPLFHVWKSLRTSEKAGRGAGHGPGHRR